MLSPASKFVFIGMICAGAIAAVIPAAAGPAIGQFETKDLESDPGEMQFQSQNAISFGQPKRHIKQPAPDELAFDDNSVTRERYALEMQMSIATWFRTRVGVEFEKERLDDPGSVARANAFENLNLTGVAIEGVFILVPVKDNGIGIGLLTEYDAAVRGGGSLFSAGPIIQAVAGPWTALANLLVVQHMGSADPTGLTPPDRKRDFAYAAQLQYTYSPAWALALEAYGTVDRIGNSGTRSDENRLFGNFDQHRIGPVVYYRFDPHGSAGNVKSAKASVTHVGQDVGDGKPDAKDDDDKKSSVSVGLGLLFGLNKNTPAESLKLSVEYNF
ncbi:MAG: hypothetical protein ABL901_03760 [Hyphomicrobiaceae bacterium]